MSGEIPPGRTGRPDTIEIGWFTFEGPFEDQGQLQCRPGLFAVFSREGEREFVMLDVDEAEDVLEGASTHERAACWRENCPGRLAFAAFYAPAADAGARRSIVREIRMQYVVPCGPKVTSTEGYFDPEE